MTRTQHFPHSTNAFPVYCLDWTDDSTILLGGGGGASRSGIGNKLKLGRVSSDGRKVAPVFELALSNDEDAPMTLALDRDSSQLVTGINASASSVQKGLNEQCRVFSYDDKELAFVRSKQTLDAEWSDDYPYQKLTALSKDGKTGYVAIGTTDNKVAILRFPSLDIVVPPFGVEGGDLVDLDWGGPQGLWLAVSTASQLVVYDFEDDGKPQLELLQTIPAPKVDDSAVAFRAARFAPDKPASPSLFTVLNSLTLRREARRRARKAYVARYDASAEEAAPSQDKESEKPTKVKGIKWELAAKREVASKPVTVFDISGNGQLVAFGSSDLSIGMLDAATLSPLLKILQAHSFPPTALKFNPSATMLASASADNTIRTVIVPSSLGGMSSSFAFIILALFILAVAFLLGRR